MAGDNIELQKRELEFNTPDTLTLPSLAILMSTMNID